MSHAAPSKLVAGSDRTTTPLFRCRRERLDPDSVRVEVIGELDLATAPQLDAELQAAQADAGLIVLDLTEVSFIDLAGCRLALGADARARAANARLVVVVGPAVERIFEITRIADRLEIAGRAR